MFREMRRFKQQVTDEECLDIIRTEKRCAISFVGDNGYPYTIPMNYYFDDSSRKFYFHCAKEGYKKDLLEANNKVCITIWNQGFQKENDWVYNVTSVVVFGSASFETDEELKRDKALQLALKYYPTRESAEAELSALNRMEMFSVSIDHMTGKLVNES